MKMIHDEMTTLCCAFIGWILVFFALSNQLTPDIFVLLLIIEIGLLYWTKFNETSPSPGLHFTRVYESIIICGPLLSGLFYFFTWFAEGMDSFAVIRAQYSVIYCYMMLISLALCSIPLLGIYFNVRMMIPWSVNLLNTLFPQDDPIIIAPGIMLLFLMGFGIMFTQHVFLITAIRGKSSFGSTSPFKRFGIVYGILALIFGTIWIIFQDRIDLWLLDQITFLFLK